MPIQKQAITVGRDKIPSCTLLSCCEKSNHIARCY